MQKRGTSSALPDPGYTADIDAKALISGVLRPAHHMRDRQENKVRQVERTGFQVEGQGAFVGPKASWELRLHVMRAPSAEDSGPQDLRISLMRLIRM
jgi:hypothetical protein